MSSRLSLAMSAAALVVAVLGSTPLGHAITSQVPRNSVGPLQIKRNAVGPSKVAPNAIRTGHVLDGSLLTADFKAGQIPQGPKGDKGDKGKDGAPGIADRQVVVSVTPSNSTNFKQVTASCPAGKTSIGGGANISGFQVAELAGSNPSGDGWSAKGLEGAPSTSDWSLQAYAVCAKVAP